MVSATASILKSYGRWEFHFGLPVDTEPRRCCARRSTRARWASRRAPPSLSAASPVCAPILKCGFSVKQPSAPDAYLPIRWPRPPAFHLRSRILRALRRRSTSMKGASAFAILATYGNRTSRRTVRSPIAARPNRWQTMLPKAARRRRQQAASACAMLCWPMSVTRRRAPATLSSLHWSRLATT